MAMAGKESAKYDDFSLSHCYCWHCCLVGNVRPVFTHATTMGFIMAAPAYARQPGFPSKNVVLHKQWIKDMISVQVLPTLLREQHK
jgi:hypothetical protein